MRLREWVIDCGKGELARLARVTGLSYPTVHGLATDRHRARYSTAKLISEATRGRVTIAELCELPPKRRARKRARKRIDSTAPAADTDDAAVA